MKFGLTILLMALALAGCGSDSQKVSTDAETKEQTKEKREALERQIEMFPYATDKQKKEAKEYLNSIDSFEEEIQKGLKDIKDDVWNTASFDFCGVRLGEPFNEVDDRLKLSRCEKYEDTFRDTSDDTIFLVDEKLFYFPFYGRFELKMPTWKNSFYFKPADGKFSLCVVAFDCGRVSAIAVVTEGDAETKEAMKKIIQEKYTPIDLSFTDVVDNEYGVTIEKANIPVLITVTKNERDVTLYYCAASILQYAEEQAKQQKTEAETERLKDAL